MCRSCPRTEAQEADLWAAPLGQIRLNDIAGWPLLISIASPYGCHAACSASKRARAFFPSLAAAAMLEKKSGELSSGPPATGTGRSPTARGLEDSLATSRRPNSRLAQILHSCGSNGDGRLKFQMAAGRAWRCRAVKKPMAAGESDQGPKGRAMQGGRIARLP
jgi:hypothetical protein